MYTTLSILALCIEILLLSYFTYKTIRLKTVFSEKTIRYTVPVFLLVYCLYTIGYIYSGKELTFFVMLKMIPTTLDAFVFNVDVELVTELSQVNNWYFAATIIATLLAGATLVASVVGLWGAKLSNARQTARAIKQGKELVLGDSEETLSYAKKNNAIVVIFGDNDRAKKLIEKKYTVIACNISKKNISLKRKFGSVKDWLSRILDKLFKLNKDEGKMYHFIAFADNEFSYTRIIDRFLTQFGDIDKNYFTLHIETSLEEMDVINRKFIDTKTSDNVCIKSFNKYELLSRKFIMEHPFSLYIPEDFYGKYRTIKREKKINVICIGFGKVNYELMKLLIMQNQFVELSDDGTRFANHCVNYYVYDNAEHRIYSEMFQKILAKVKRLRTADLPVPEKICNIAEVEKTNVYSVGFADKLDEIICDENAYTLVLVSMGSDYENMAYAEHLSNAYNEDKLKVFARIRETETLKKANNTVVGYGYDDDILTRDVLINDSLDSLARGINKKYSINSATEIEEYNARPTIERYSNIYHAASIFFKMGLLGLKFVDKNTVEGHSGLKKADLFERYAGYTDIIDYNKYFELNVWSMLGFSEHSRWVAQYLLKGFRAMPLSEIVVNGTRENVKVVGKNIDARKHCCLTDYYGLDNYHKHLLKLYIENGANKSIDDVETYKYDYMFINDNYDDMIKNGYVLVDA